MIPVADPRSAALLREAAVGFFLPAAGARQTTDHQQTALRG